MIEVAIPLESINAASDREKSIRHGHPNTLHVWWARRPLATARAIIFCQVVDDPSSIPELFPTEQDQEQERLRLFALISKFVQWENINNQDVLNQAHREILRSWRRCCEDNSDHPEAKSLFDPEKLPQFHDPFSGGGTIPLEAQRLGFISNASDLNPVSVLINKSIIEIPSKFSDIKPVNPDSKNSKKLINIQTNRYDGICSDINFYGNWIENEAKKRIGYLYPLVDITTEIVGNRTSLKKYEGKKLNVIAWLWARTVKSPEPNFSSCDIPLLSTYVLSSKKGKEAFIRPVINGENYKFEVVYGNPRESDTLQGTKISKGNFKCILSGSPIEPNYIRDEARKGNLGYRLVAIVLEGDRERIYIEANSEHEKLAKCKPPVSIPETEFFQDALGFRIGNYGMSKWKDLFTARQLLTLKTFCDLINEAKIKIEKDALSTHDRDYSIQYSEAISIYLAFCIDRLATRLSTLCIWNRPGQKIEQAFRLQVFSMTWDFAEANVFSGSSGSWEGQLKWIPNALLNFPQNCSKGSALQADAQRQTISNKKIISTDPPYYDMVGYADLSDFFYVWLRQILKKQFPTLLGTLSTPKSEELVATPARHGGKDNAYKFFIDGMSKALKNTCEQAHPAQLSTIYYAFKQTQKTSKGGTSSTGWETFLESIISSKLIIYASWPLRTELSGGLRVLNRNSLTTSLVLACAPKTGEEPIISKLEFRRQLLLSIPKEIAILQKIGMNPADIHQGIIGCGMCIFSSADEVTKSDDTLMTIREALETINAVYDESLSGDEHLFDSETSFALTFFESFGYKEITFGEAESIAKARNISVESVSRSGIIRAGGGKVQLIRRSQYDINWTPDSEKKYCLWSITQHLINRLQDKGESSAASLLMQINQFKGNESFTDNCLALAYRLYNYCEKANKSEDALSYNGLIISWPELERIASSEIHSTATQTTLL